MRLTKKQKEALNAAPLYLGQSEYNLNYIYWTNGENNLWFTQRTVDSLTRKGLLVASPEGNHIMENK